MTRLQLVVLAAVLFSVRVESNYYGDNYGKQCRLPDGVGICLSLPECIDPRHPPQSGSATPEVKCSLPLICCLLQRRRRQVYVPPSGHPSTYADPVASTPVLSRQKKYMVLIGYGPRDNIDPSCEGAVISQNHVLAAAHCAQHPTLGQAKWAILGDVAFAITKDLKSVEREIVEVIVHPGYKSSELQDDIALFRLDRSVDLETLVQSVCLHRGPALPDKQAVLIGWGGGDDVLATLAMGHHLIQETVDFFNDSVCHELFDKSLPKGIDTESMFCAGKLTEISDDCTGDSSGPLVVENEAGCPYTLVGLHSFGSCGRFDAPAVFTRVSHYLSWVEEIVSSQEPRSITLSAETSKSNSEASSLY